MVAYKKTLVFFKNLNTHRTFITHKKTINFIFSFRNHKVNVNLNKILISLFSSINVIHHINIKKSIILVVGNSYTSFCSNLFYSKPLKNVFFIQRWVHGLLSNWEAFDSLISSSKARYCNSHTRNSFKLRFFRLFYSVFGKALPTLVIVFQNSKIDSIIQECFYKDIPVIAVGNKPCTSSYHLYLGSNTLFVNIVFFQLLLCQFIVSDNIK
jgi:ribosomal protein S2